MNQCGIMDRFRSSAQRSHNHLFSRKNSCFFSRQYLNSTFYWFIFTLRCIQSIYCISRMKKRRKNACKEICTTILITLKMMRIWIVFFFFQNENKTNAKIAWKCERIKWLKCNKIVTKTCQIRCKRSIQENPMQTQPRNWVTVVIARKFMYTLLVHM